MEEVCARMPRHTWHHARTDPPALRPSGACLSARTLRQAPVRLLNPWWLFLPHCFCPTSWAKGSRHALGPTLSRCAKMVIARNIQNAKGHRNCNLKQCATRYLQRQPTSIALVCTVCVRTSVSCAHMCSRLLGYCHVSSQHGSVGGGLHCEPQGERLVQCLFSLAVSRHQ